MQSCLRERDLNAMFSIDVYEIFVFILSLALALGLFFGFRGTFSEHGPRFQNQLYETRAYAQVVIAWLELLLSQADATGLLTFDVMGDTLTAFPDEVATIPYDTEEYGPYAQFVLFDAQDEMGEYLVSLSESAHTGTDIYSEYPDLFMQGTEFHPCYNGKPVWETQVGSLMEVLSTMIVNSLYLRDEELGQWWSPAPWAEVPDLHPTVTTLFCNVLNAWDGISKVLIASRQEATLSADHQCRDEQKLFVLLLKIVPAVYGALLLGPCIACTVILFRELQHICQLVSKTPQEAKIIASSPIRLQSCDDVSHEDRRPVETDMFVIVLVVLIVLCILGLIGVTAGVFYDQRRTSKDLQSVNLQLEHAHLLKPVICDLTVSMLKVLLLMRKGNGVLATGPQVGRLFGAMNSTEATDLGRELARFDELLALSKSLLVGLISSDEARVFDLDPTSGDLVRKESCEGDKPRVDMHETYRCVSLIVALNIYFDFASSLRDTVELRDGSIADEYPVNMLHELSYHLIPVFDTLRERLGGNLPDTIQARFNSIGVYLLIGMIAVMLVMQVLIAVLKDAIETTLAGLLAFIRRMSPETIVAHRDLLNYLLDSESDLKTGWSMTRSIIHTSNDGIVCLNSQMMIETVNTGTQSIFGYTPEQLLGQSFAVLFHKDAATKIRLQAEMMLRREAARTWSEALPCVNEASLGLPCSVTLLGVLNKRKEVNAFVIIFRDISEHDRQEQEAADAKSRNEKLLYEILPRGVVSQINQGEKNISFVVESCSLQFIDIQKFSDYAQTLSPAETMVNLSSIFTGYDANLVKYDLVMKMKLIGDVYMVSAGLFAPKANPLDHASQIISFGLDALDVIDQTNIRLDANLSVRVGVNSGGPVIAGVLGQAVGKPLFDILGDPINIAARLQSTDIPGKVQISESTYDLVRASDFTIEPRGEVFLKGKGMRPAYLVSRKAASILQARSVFGQISSIVSGASFRRMENSLTRRLPPPPPMAAPVSPRADVSGLQRLEALLD